MSLHNAITMRAKDMMRRKEFFVALLFSLLLLLVPTVLDIIKLIGKDTSSLYPAWYYFGLAFFINSTDHLVATMRQCLNMFLLPFLASLAYSYCIFDEQHNGTIKMLLTRMSRTKYYVSSAILTFLGAFFVILIPMILYQVVFSIAVPLESMQAVASQPILDDSFLDVEYFRSLRANSPYLYSLLYCFIPAFISGLIGLLSFSISLFYKKNKFLVITIPGILWLLFAFICPKFDHPELGMGYMIAPPFGLSNMKLSSLIIAALALLGVNIIAIWYKIRVKKDEL